MTVRHVAVWIDHKQAKIFHVEPEGFDAKTIEAPHHHVTRKAEEQGHHAGSERFFHDVAVALKDAEEILVVGPAATKLDFVRHLHKHDAEIERRVLGLETLDHPTDGQLASYVRHYFHGKDRMLGRAP